MHATQLDVLVSAHQLGAVSDGGGQFGTVLRQIMLELADQRDVVVDESSLDPADSGVPERV